MEQVGIDLHRIGVLDFLVAQEPHHLFLPVHLRHHPHPALPPASEDEHPHGHRCYQIIKYKAAALTIYNSNIRDHVERKC